MRCPVAVGWVQFLPCKVLSHCEVSCHGTSVKVQNVLLCETMLIPWQLRFSLYSGAVITEGRCSLFTSLLWFLSRPCPMPYAWIVASCSMGCLLSDCSLDLVFPISHCPYLFSLSTSDRLITLEACGLPLYLEFPPIELWDSLSSLVNPGIVCLGSLSSDWPDALWASLSSV